MSLNYSNEVMEIFYSPKNIYKNGDEINLIGHAGDTSIGEYIHLYFKIQKSKESVNYADNLIVEAKFSAIGGVVLIAAADKFCSLIRGISFQDALQYCDSIAGLQHILLIPQEKIYSINFIMQAFYRAIETLTIT